MRTNIILGVPNFKCKFLKNVNIDSLGLFMDCEQILSAILKNMALGTYKVGLSDDPGLSDVGL